MKINGSEFQFFNFDINSMVFFCGCILNTIWLGNNFVYWFCIIIGTKWHKDQFDAVEIGNVRAFVCVSVCTVHSN